MEITQLNLYRLYRFLYGNKSTSKSDFGVYILLPWLTSDKKKS